MAFTNNFTSITAAYQDLVRTIAAELTVAPELTKLHELAFYRGAEARCRLSRKGPITIVRGTDGKFHSLELVMALYETTASKNLTKNEQLLFKSAFDLGVSVTRDFVKDASEAAVLAIEQEVGAVLAGHLS